MEVPFSDLHSQYLSLKEEIDKAISTVIEDSAFVRGRHVDEFEAGYASLVGADHCVSCANGTESLVIAMKALGIRPGDEVIVPAHTWISTAESVTNAGGKVVFADTDKNTFTICPRSVREKITSKTVGIIPVHLYGQPAEMDELLEISQKYSLWIIEDCAQAHLAKYKGEMVGSFGQAASYSFYPGKNLGAMGDAGAVTTNSGVLAEHMRRYSLHGGLKKGEHLIEGTNSRLDGIQAAILNVKMKKLAGWTSKRQDLARRYNWLLRETPRIDLPLVTKWSTHVWHLYVVKVPDRDRVRKELNERGIQTIINYPVSLPFLPAYSHLGHIYDDFPNAFHNQSRILSIPLYPELNAASQEYVAHSIDKVLSQTYN